MDSIPALHDSHKPFVQREYPEVVKLSHARPPSPADAPPYPFAHSPRWDGIPPELKQLKRWVVWRYEWDGRKWKKPPYSARSGRAASVTNADTWSTYHAARAAYDSGGWDGVGIVLGEGLAAADLDECIIGGELSPLALDTLAALDSYAELSPSGEGVHVLVTDAPPMAGLKSDELELYSAARYVTVTGRHLDGTPPTVERRPLALATLAALHFSPPSPSPSPARESVTTVTLPPALAPSDDAILAKARAARNGARFVALYDGEGLTDDASADDLALANMLAYWADGDASAVDRLFRASARWRPKWDEKHYTSGETYGARTIAKALDGRSTWSAAPTPTPSPSRELERLRARVERLENELDDEREARERAEKALDEAHAILTTPEADGWELKHKVGMLYLVVTAARDGGEVRIERGASGLRERVSMSKDAADAVTNALEDAGLVERSTVRRRGEDGEFKTEAVLAYTSGTIGRVLPISGYLPRLEKDKRTKKKQQREAARTEQRERERVEKDARIDELENALAAFGTCPDCGGESHSAVCNGCGCVLATNAPGVDIVHFDVENADADAADAAHRSGHCPLLTEQNGVDIVHFGGMGTDVPNVPTVGGEGASGPPMAHNTVGTGYGRSVTLRERFTTARGAA